MAERIAIVGTGIAGLTASYLLSRKHDLTVFEANDYVGGHSHTVMMPAADSAVGVDTGFIVYNRRTYPNFCRLLEELAVPTQPSDMSFSFSDETTGLEYGAPELSRLFAQPANLVRPRFWRMLGQIRRFYRESPRLLAAARQEEELSLEDYLTREGYDDAFKEDHLFPVAAAIWSGSRQRMGAFPARAFVRFFQNHGLLSFRDRPRWRTITGGSVRYVEKLSAPFKDRIRLSCPVTGIRRDDAGVTVTTPAAGAERFDKVVLACHADQALGLLEDPTPLERELLAAFPYGANDVILHSDTGLLPRRRAAWSSWNYHRLADGHTGVAVTYDQNRLQRLPTRTPYLVTLNRTEAIAPGLIHDRFVYHHPQYDARGIALQPRHAELDGQNRTHYCGAYWGYGFHEDGVVSGLNVARQFGEDL
jgi:predicted NAD/FAD-binding protein